LGRVGVGRLESGFGPTFWQTQSGNRCYARFGTLIILCEFGVLRSVGTLAFSKRISINVFVPVVDIVMLAAVL